jgi:hypothetical protein
MGSLLSVVINVKELTIGENLMAAVGKYQGKPQSDVNLFLGEFRPLPPELISNDIRPRA